MDDPAHLDVAAIVPVYNNEKTVLELAGRLRAAFGALAMKGGIVFVNDCGPDGSLKTLHELAASDESVTVVENQVNLGQQQSIRRGLKAVTADYYVVLDADLQDPPEEIPKMMQKLLAADCHAVFAYRKGAYQGGMRMLTSRVFKYLIYLMVKLPKGTGGFVTFTKSVRDYLVTINTKRFYLAGLIAKSKLPLATVETVRNVREVGESSYNSFKRLRHGISNVLCLMEKGEVD